MVDCGHETLRAVQVLGASIAAGRDGEATTLAVRVAPSPLKTA